MSTNTKSKLVGQCDLELATAVGVGSETAFEELHRLYAPRLYRTIFSIIRNREDAEDALQETLMRAYLALGSFEGRSKLISWLTRIAINTSLMSLRKRRAQREASIEPLSRDEDEPLEFQVKDPSLNPEECCLQHERGLLLVNAMAALKPPLRTVMQIQVSQQCSIKEIAQSLDVSVATVKSRLHRARRRLAKPAPNETRIWSHRIGTNGSIIQGLASGNENKY